MEDDLQKKWKTTSNFLLNQRRPKNKKRKTTSKKMEDDLKMNLIGRAAVVNSPSWTFVFERVQCYSFVNSGPDA
jgi:hypothetical protein